MKFTCIGFDIRKWPELGRLTTELDDWERPNDLHQKAISELNLEENSYQLIEVHDNEELQRLIDFIFRFDDANLLAISLSTSVAKISPRRGCDTSDLRLNNFIFRGYDVFDFNGSYSFAAHYTPKEQLNEFGLLAEDNLVWALESMQLTQFNDPGHCPVVLAKLLTLK